MADKSTSIAFIHELNEDCLLSILEYLTLEDQVNLWQATKSAIPASRLNSLITYNWQKQTKHIIKRDIFQEHLEYLDDYLKCINESVEELELSYLPIELVEIFRQHKFPYIQKLYYYADEEDNENGDKDIALLTEIFPSLRSLVLSGMSTGFYISKFENLSELDLEECVCLKPDNFLDISEHLKLRKLSMQVLASNGPLFIKALPNLRDIEELTISMDLLTETDTVQILRLPKLRKLRYNSDIVRHIPFNSIVEIRGLDIIRATFHDSIYICNPEIFPKLQNLQALSIIEDYGWNREDLMKILQCLNSLEELHLIDTEILRNDEHLWDVARICPKLRLVNLTKNCFYQQFFTSEKEIMEKTLNGRKERLQVNLYQTDLGLNTDMILEHFRHPNLNVTYQDMDIEHLAESDIQIEFKPLAV